MIFKRQKKYKGKTMLDSCIDHFKGESWVMERWVVEGKMWGGVSADHIYAEFYQLVASPVASDESLERDTHWEIEGGENKPSCVFQIRHDKTFLQFKTFTNSPKLLTIHYAKHVPNCNKPPLLIKIQNQLRGSHFLDITS